MNRSPVGYTDRFRLSRIDHLSAAQVINTTFPAMRMVRSP
jgi:hypothetical protein